MWDRRGTRALPPCPPFLSSRAPRLACTSWAKHPSRPMKDEINYYWRACRIKKRPWRTLSMFHECDKVFKTGLSSLSALTWKHRPPPKTNRAIPWRLTCWYLSCNLVKKRIRKEASPYLLGNVSNNPSSCCSLCNCLFWLMLFIFFVWND